MKIFLIGFLVFVITAAIAGTIFISLPTKVLEDFHDKTFEKGKKEKDNSL